MINELTKALRDHANTTEDHVIKAVFVKLADLFDELEAKHTAANEPVTGTLTGTENTQS